MKNILFVKIGLCSLCLLSAAMLINGCGVYKDATATFDGATTARFSTPSALQIPAIEGQGTSTKVLAGNFNSDPWIDLAVVSDSGIIIYINQESASWLRFPLVEGIRFSSGFVADLNYDAKKVDDLILFAPQVGPQIWIGDGGSFSRESQLGRAQSISDMVYIPSQLSDQKKPLGNLLVAAAVGQHYSVNLENLQFVSGTVDTSWGLAVPAEAGCKLVVGDWDQDGDLDALLIPRSKNIDLILVENDKDQFFRSKATLRRSFSSDIFDAIASDLNADGKMDFVLATDQGLEAYIATSPFAFSLAATLNPNLFSSAISSLVAKDFTGDGKLDLFGLRSSGSEFILAQGNSLEFSDITSLAFADGELSTGAIDLLSVDINNDGKLDLVELFSSGRIAIRLNSR